MVEDRNAWRSSALVAFAFVALAVNYCNTFYGLNHHGQKFVPIDEGMLLGAGHFLITGHARIIYSAEPGLYDLPLSFPVVAPLVWLLDLTGRWTYPAESQFYFVAPYYGLLSVPLIYGVRRMAWDLGRRQRLLAVQVVTCALVSVPLFEFGHIEDVLALTAVVFALRRLYARDRARAALLLSVAISFKQWAVILVPLFVLAAPAGERLRAAIRASALPALLGGAFLIIDFHGAATAFFSPQTMVKGFPGHPWFDGTWLGPHSSLVNRASATVLAGLAAWSGRAWIGRPERLVALTGFILLIRPLTETINYSYYWSPGLLLVAVVAMSAPRTGRETGRRHGSGIGSWTWAVAAVGWTLPRSTGGMPIFLWWAGELLLLTMTALAVRRSLAQYGATGGDGDWSEVGVGARVGAEVRAGAGVEVDAGSGVGAGVRAGLDAGSGVGAGARLALPRRA